MAVLAVGVGAYAFVLLAAPTFGAPFLADRIAAMPLAAYGHIAGGAVAMILGAFQVNAMIRQRSLTRHRWLGRIYVAAVLIGAPSGLVLATVSEGGMVTHVAFGLLAVLWFGTTAMAYVQIRAAQHSRASTVDDPKLCVDARCRDAASLHTRSDHLRHFLRSRVPGDLMALLGAEFDRRRMDHPAP